MESQNIEIIKKNIIDIKQDGSFRLNQEYFDYSTGMKMINQKFEKLFGIKSRSPESKITEFHMDIAHSIQYVLEEVILKIIKSLKKEYKIENLCLAGGVALNCVVNGLIQKKKIFKKIWIQPASGDAGGSLVSALAVWYMHLNNKRNLRKDDEMSGAYLGPNFSSDHIKKSLNNLGAKYTVYDRDNVKICS